MGTGDYVRTKNGIVRIAEIKNGVMKDENDKLHYGDFIKSSPNIIDLIEENDYIRLQDRGDTYYQVVEVPWSRGRNILAIEDRGWDELEEIYDKEEIISVITHEQMKSMEYEVK